MYLEEDAETSGHYRSLVEEEWAVSWHGTGHSNWDIHFSLHYARNSINLLDSLRFVLSAIFNEYQRVQAVVILVLG